MQSNVKHENWNLSIGDDPVTLLSYGVEWTSLLCGDTVLNTCSSLPTFGSWTEGPFWTDELVHSMISVPLKFLAFERFSNFKSITRRYQSV